MDSREAIQLDHFLPHPPEVVWRALTDSELLARWLMPNDFEPVVGRRFSFRGPPGPDFDGRVECRLLELHRPSLVRIAWAGDNGIDTEVVWRLEREGRGTRLFIEQTGFEPGDDLQRRAREAMAGGWASMLERRLRAVLADERVSTLPG